MVAARARKKPIAAKLRNWRASIIRKRGQYLSDEGRRRLVVQERG
jgi:hypothetical protein